MAIGPLVVVRNDDTRGGADQVCIGGVPVFTGVVELAPGDPARNVLNADPTSFLRLYAPLPG